MHGTLFVIRPTKKKTPAEFDVDSIVNYPTLKKVEHVPKET